MIKDWDLRAISLGAGVQSSVLYIMAARGVFGHVPDVAIFADTQSEPQYVYDHLDWLDNEYSSVIPIRRVTAGSLEKDILQSRDGRSRFAAIPLRVMGRDGRPSMLRRQCTREYKFDPIKREIRNMLGLRPRQRAQGKFMVEQWIGISTDEAQRAKDSRYPWLVSRFPLLFDRPMSRAQCMQWLQNEGLPTPKKSSCYFCPFHDDATWAWMRDNDKASWDRAVWFDREVRNGKLRGVKEEVFLHRSLKPLNEVKFKPKDRGNLSFGFANECEGMCGV